MNKVDFLRTDYKWVNDIDEILNVENDPYFTLVDTRTGESYKTIYVGKVGEVLSFVYYNLDAKEMNSISILPADISSENYEFYKNGKRFYFVNAISIFKALVFSVLKAGKAYRMKQDTKNQDVIYLGSTSEELVFARYDDYLYDVKKYYVKKNDIVSKYELYEFEE